MLLAAAIAIAVSAIVAALLALRSAERSRVDLSAAKSRLAKFEADISGQTDEVSVGAEALRRDVRVTFEAREAAQDRVTLSSLLADFRDVTGAQEAIFWRWK